MDKQFLMTVTDYMAGAAKLRDDMTSKIAGLTRENERLRGGRVTSAVFRDVVSKLASAGLVDKPNQAHFDKTTTDGNVADQLAKLANLLTRASVVGKSASSPAPYKVRAGGQATTQEEAARHLHERLSKLIARA